MVPSGSYFGGGAVASIVRFALTTLLAWTTTVSLFVILNRAPLTRSVTVIALYVPLCSLLPWVVGCAFGIKVRIRAKLGIADREASRFCVEIIDVGVTAAYVAMVCVDGVLLWVLIRPK